MQSILYRYKLPIKGSNSSREGLILRLKKNDKIGYGEISPLPNWSLETFQQAIDQVLYLQRMDFTDNLKVFPSVSFGIEMAKYSLMPCIPSKKQLPYAYLLYGSKEQILEKIASLPLGVYAKLKTIDLSKAAIFKITLLLLEKNISLSIDPNKTWTKEYTFEFCNYFSSHCIRYIEEPVENFDDLVMLAHKLPHRFALDETIRKFPINTLLQYPFYDWILKPTLLGGLSTCLYYATIAKEHNIRVYLSSSWESGLGLSHIIEMYLTTELFSSPLGLDTYHFYEDLLETRLRFTSGMIEIPKVAILNENMIIPISSYEMFH